MSNIKRGALALVLFGSIAATAAACDITGDKVVVCHRAHDKFVKVTIAQQAVKTHLVHGDFVPDEYGECVPH